MVLLLGMPPFIIVHLYKEFAKWDNKEFKEKFGTLFEDKNIKSRSTVITLLILFFLRRLIFALSIVLIEDFLWAQIALQVFFAIGMIIFIQHY